MRSGALVETALKAIEKEPGTKKIYWCTKVVKRNDPGACDECGIAAGTTWAAIDEDDLRREDLAERVAERLDRGMYASEACPGCARTMVLYRAVEVED